ncbi:hypothetical protein [Metallosphaera sedula]|uniref:hypothetical protein n=1 Tax=Metallosphaera sedula TaxID=43687 RepID=UPI0020BE9F17|nr:hypothetical protein [Metallosphaera sedula]
MKWLLLALLLTGIVQGGVAPDHIVHYSSPLFVLNTPPVIGFSALMNFSWFPSVNNSFWLHGIWIGVNGVGGNVTFLQEGVSPSGDVFMNFAQWWNEKPLYPAPNTSPLIITFVKNSSEITPFYKSYGPVLVTYDKNVNFTIYRSSLRDGVAVWTFLMDNYTVYRVYSTMTYADQIMIVMETDPNAPSFYITPLNFSHILVEYPNGSWMPMNTVPLRDCPPSLNGGTLVHWNHDYVILNDSYSGIYINTTYFKTLNGTMWVLLPPSPPPNDTAPTTPPLVLDVAVGFVVSFAIIGIVELVSSSKRN